MKFTLFLGVVALLVCLAQAQPVVLDTEADLDLSPVAAAEPAPELYSRQRRATCDLLSGFNVNHSACAVHCVAMGRKGGYCNGKAVCVCRR